ncbi:MAG: AmmeMemoRadiSam system radical SAM enzyme [Deltaproteobacteria bacterium]|nr:AmmeMemoRadiSam system radical SAM enzyme [Deltaproteobacteria bacterium]
MKEALLYEKLEGGKVHCFLCQHHCRISSGKRGICGVRENKEGTLYTLVYDHVISCAVDPIEKKPLFNFLPGSKSYSIATVGCNFKCLHCQNYDISQMPAEKGGVIMGSRISPEEIVADAKAHHCATIAYTYTEPTIFFELARDTGQLAKSEGIKNIFVSNGYMTEEMLQMSSDWLDGINIDLKGFTEEHYKKICGAKLGPVLDSLRMIKKMGIWLEVTTLVIPGYNDSDESFENIADFIKNELGAETPWHVTAFYPTYKLLDVPRTPVETLGKARDIGLNHGLKYVYEGNIPGEGGENTICYNCGELLIERYGYMIRKNSITSSACPECGAHIDGYGLMS